MLFNTILKRSAIPLILYECVSNDIRSTLRLWSGHHVANNLLYSFIECTGEEYRAIAVTVGNGDAFLGWHERWRRFGLARRRQEGWHDIESRRMGSKSGSGKRVAVHRYIAQRIVVLRGLVTLLPSTDWFVEKLSTDRRNGNAAVTRLSRARACQPRRCSCHSVV